MELVKDMLAGDVLALARLITKVERDSGEVPEMMKLVGLSVIFLFFAIVSYKNLLRD